MKKAIKAFEVIMEECIRKGPSLSFDKIYAISQTAIHDIKKDHKFCPECFDGMTTGNFCKLCGRKL